MSNIKMVSVTFSMGSENNKKTETFKVEEDCSDDEIDAMLLEWIVDRSNGFWSKE